jgi:hypothetical protein
MPKTRDEHRSKGQDHAAGKVSLEAHGADDRWIEDQNILKGHGMTPAMRAVFHGLILEHDTLRAERPETIAVKLERVKVSSALKKECRQWIDRAFCVLDGLALSNDEVVTGLVAVKAKASDGLDAELSAHVALLRTHLALLDPDVSPDELIRTGESLAERLKAATPSKDAAMAATKSDTEELDVLDGRLIEIIAKLNNAGRKAFRALNNQAKVETYKYHYLQGKPSETGPETPSEPPTPTPSKPPTPTP